MSRQSVPPGKMKITVNVAAELVKAAKKLAFDRGGTLGQLIEEGLRWVLSHPGSARKPK